MFGEIEMKRAFDNCLVVEDVLELISACPLAVMYLFPLSFVAHDLGSVASSIVDLRYMYQRYQIAVDQLFPSFATVSFSLLSLLT
jgi:hypothetical protein